MIGFNGGLIGAARETSAAPSVPGVWTPREQLEAQRAALWPFFSDDPYFANVSLLLRGDGTNGSTTIVDSSPSPKTVTAFGDAQISTAQSNFGGSSLRFDGSGDYLLIAANSGLSLPGDFTIELWHFLVANAQYPAPLSSGGYFSGTNSWYFNVTQSAVTFYVKSTGGNVTSVSTALNQWNHFAIARSGSTLRIFKNGTQLGSFTNSASLTDGGVNGLNIGRLTIYGSMNGYIDDLRITKGVARYTSNFTPPGAL